MIFRRTMLIAAYAVIALLAGSAQAQDPQPPPPAPNASVTPELDFGTQQRPGTSAQEFVTLQNDGSAPLGIEHIVIVNDDTGSFEKDDTGTTCSVAAPLAPSTSCRVGVRFKPQAEGVLEAKLEFQTANNEPKVLNALLKGTGTSPPPPPPPPPPPSPPSPAPPPPPGDLDRDSVIDSVDSCPGVPGALSNGCPLDRDGDGVVDDGDACPAEAGSLQNGCPRDRDRDDVIDSEDRCIRVAGNLKNGCPNELNAEVRGRWRVNNLRSQLLSLTVRASTGSRIELRCGRRGGCGFTKRSVFRTTKRLTSLTRHFKGRRILRSRVAIIVRVTRPQQIGTYESLRTRTGRKLPKVTQRCIVAGTKAKLTRCT